MVVGWGVSTLASWGAMKLTERDFREGRATLDDVKQARASFGLGSIPYFGALIAGRQLLWDLGVR
jgi:hypothetical protein